MVVFVFLTFIWCIAAEFSWRTVKDLWPEEADGLMLAVCILLGPVALIIGIVAGTIDYFAGRNDR